MEEDLLKYNIHKYYFKNEELYVDQDVDMAGRGLDSFPLDIHTINGDLNLNGNHLENTKGFPKFINGDVVLSYNKIRHFQEFSEITGSLLIESNQIISLKGIKKVNHIFAISNNSTLKSLSYAPIIINFDESAFFYQNTGISQIEIDIYIECLKRGKWDPTKTTEANAYNVNEKMQVDFKKFLTTKTITKYGL